MRSRRKGKRGELEAAAEIRRVLGKEARRGRQFCGSDQSPDVVSALASVHFEVKRAESLRLYAALDQAIADAGANLPIVLHKQNHREWVAIMRFCDLPALVETLHAQLSAATSVPGSIPA